MEKKYRLQIDFGEQPYHELEALQENLSATSKSEVIRDALAVLKWVTDEISQGHRILAERPEGDREIVFPFLHPRKQMKAAG